MAGQLRHEELQDGAAGSPPQDVGQVFKGIISLITITWPHLLRGKRPSLRSESADLQTACEVASPRRCVEDQGQVLAQGGQIGDKE